MKKLDVKDLKKIYGCINRLCERHCLKIYENCLGTVPPPPWDCQGLHDECIAACYN